MIFNPEIETSCTYVINQCGCDERPRIPGGPPKDWWEHCEGIHGPSGQDELVRQTDIVMCVLFAICVLMMVVAIGVE